MKKLPIILCMIFFIQPFLGFTQCNPAQPYAAAAAQTQTTVEIYLTGTTSGGIYYVEYGPVGFTPGTAGVAGVGGTLLSLPTSTNLIVLTGLTPNTMYHVYCRKNCSGVWSANSTITSGSSSGKFKTAFDCGAATTIGCNSFVNSNHLAIDGAWTGACVPLNNNPYGTEVVYRFSPSVSGMHSLFVPNNTGSTEATYKYKLATGSCDNVGWTCIGHASYNSDISQFSFGPLTAGSTYFIMADANNTYSASTSSFRIECPYCASPTNVTTSNLYPTSATISWSGSGTQVLEYGPSGFIPGTGSTAGTNGTAIVVSGSSYQLNNLTPGTNYNLYLRQICGGGNYSPNCIMHAFSTRPCPYTTVYTPGTGYANLAFPSGYTGDYNYVGNCVSTNFPGMEQVLRFTAPSTGYFELLVNNALFSPPLNFQVAMGQNCSINSATCLNLVAVSGSLYTYSLGPLTGGSTYDLFFDTDTVPSFPIYANLSISIRCPAPISVFSSNIQPTSATINWSCSTPCSSAMILEYGPAGFTPGTGATAGTNGTIKNNVTSPYSLTGLTSTTRYDVYVRSNCGGIYSANTLVHTFKTAFDCGAATVLTCGSYDSYIVPGFSTIANAGSWTSPACNNSNNLAPEKVWAFTPTLTGTYSLYFYSFSANSTGYTYPSNYYIKQQSLLCNESNWSCVGTLNWGMLSQTPISLSLGNLTAGTTYYIMADGVQPTNTGSYRYNFRLDCPGTCPNADITVASTTATTASFNGTCPSCAGTLYVEYGPAGFTPGTNANAGTGGTIISNPVFPLTISGLTSGTTYDIYIRNDCGAPSGFSTNSVKKTFTPCYTSPTAITTNTGNSTICAGNSITLTQNNGVIPSGGVFAWYSGSCGGTFVGNGNSVTVSPSVTTTYYLRIESSCGTSNCNQLTITVNAPVATITPAGPTSFCSGGSVILNANTGGGLTYQWKNGGVNIGQTGTSYTANTSGSYTVEVTNSSGCTKLSNPTVVTVNPIPNVSFTGLAGTYSDADPIAPLLGNPTGGTFSGPGIVSNTFNPSIAGVGGPYTVLYSYTDVNGCSNSSSQQTTVTGCTGAPAQPGVISTTGGATPVCPGDSKTYSIIAVNGATSYNWTAPTGGTISSGQGTVSVTVNYGIGFTAASNLTVAAVNNCGSSVQSTLNISRNNPAQPGTITTVGGAAAVCPGDSKTYSINAVSGATTYNWTAPTGGTISSGQGTVSVSVNYAAGFTAASNLTVVSVNGCGNSALSSLTINRNNPTQPGAITTVGGAAAVCPGESKTYSIVAVPGATSYTWTPPAGGVISSGPGTVSVTVNYGAGFTATANLIVVATNNCGTSPQRTLNIVRNTAPAQPSTITGEAYGLCNNTNIAYSVTAIPGVTNNWSFNNVNTTVASGQGTNAITANFNSLFLTTATLTVTASNGCGTSPARTLIVNAIPAMPVSITGALAVCVNQQDVPYSITPLFGAANYSWISPKKSHPSDGVVVSNNTNLTTTSASITVDYGNSGGILKVRSNNTCGSSAYKEITVIMNCRMANTSEIVSLEDILIFPNPARDEVNINAGSLSEFEIALYNVLGEKIYTGINQTKINLIPYKPGLYFIQVKSGSTIKNEKLIIE